MQRLRFDLPDAFACHERVLTYLLARLSLAVDAEELLDNVLLARMERGDHLVDVREDLVVPDRHDLGALIAEHAPHEHLAQMLERLGRRFLFRHDRHEHVVPPVFGAGEWPRLRVARVADYHSQDHTEQSCMILAFRREAGNRELFERELQPVEHREDQIFAKPRRECNADLSARLIGLASLVVHVGEHDLSVASDHRSEHVVLLFRTIRECFEPSQSSDVLGERCLAPRRDLCDFVSGESESVDLANEWLSLSPFSVIVSHPPLLLFHPNLVYLGWLPKLSRFVGFCQCSPSDRSQGSAIVEIEKQTRVGL